MSRNYRTWLFAAALAAAFAFGATWYAAACAPGVRSPGGLLAVPLDDAAIYFQYARQALRGDWLRYYPGAPVSTGVTSALYFLLMVLGRGLGSGGPVWAWLLGLCGLLLGLVSADRLARRLFPGLPSWWAGLLLLSQGAWVEAHFNGMETGLLLGLTWATLDAVSEEEVPAWRFWGVLGALAFTRPEGQVLAVLLGGARVLSDSEGRRGARTAVLLLLAAAPSLLLLAVSGSVVPDSVRPKAVSLFGGMAPLDHASGASLYAVGVLKGAWMGFWGGADAVGTAGGSAAGNPIGPQFPPLALLGALLGFCALARQEGLRRVLALACLASLACLLGLLAWNLPVGWHDFRYLSCATPLLLFGMLAACQALGGDGRPLARAGRDALFLLWVAFGLASWPWHLWRCYDGAVHYARANTNAALALRTLPPGPVAVVDSGLLAYYSGREIVDLPGITDHAQALALPQGPGAMLETMLRRPRLPVFAALHDDRPDFDLKPWLASGLLIRVGPLAQDMSLYRWDFQGVGRRLLPLSPPPGDRRLLDSLDVADLEDEAAHGARFSGGDGLTLLARLRLGPGGPLLPEGGRRVAELGLPRHARGSRYVTLRAAFADVGLLVLSQDGGHPEQLPVEASPSGTYSEVTLPLDPARDGSVSFGFLKAVPGKPPAPGTFAVYRLWFWGR